MDEKQRYGWGHLIAVVVAVTVVWAACLIFTPVKAHAVEPYGGCEEAYQVLDSPKMLGSKGVRYCRNHGWLIRKDLVVDPYGFAVTNLPGCTEENDQDPCYWDAWHMGNGKGSGYVALHGRTVYLDSVNGRWVTKKKSDRLGMWVMKPWLS